MDLVSLAEAELDRRERVLAQIVGTAVVGTVDKKTYSDILIRNVHNTSMHTNPVYTTPVSTHATNAPHTAVRSAQLGESAQDQRRPAAQAGGGTSSTTSRPSGRTATDNSNMYRTYTCDFPLIKSVSIGKGVGESNHVGVGGKSGGNGCRD